MNATESIKVTYNSDRLVKIIEVQSGDTMDTDRFHKLAKALVPNFKLTSSGTNDMGDFHHDSKNKWLIVKDYATLKKYQLTKK